jgi:hypothetical protein
VKPDVNSVKVHPLLRHKGHHPVDGWCAGGCWFTLAMGPPNHGSGPPSLKRKKLGGEKKNMRKENEKK